MLNLTFFKEVCILSREKFLKGATILTGAGLLVKLIGAFGKIILARVIGAEGMGVFTIAYAIYLVAISISTAGIPSAIAILIAEKLAQGDSLEAQRVFNISFKVLFILGSLLSFVMYYYAKFAITLGIIQDPRTYYAIVILSPAIIFVTIEAVLRGYFQGFQEMIPNAISQIGEQIFRVLSMLGAAYLGMHIYKSVELGAAGANFGALPGAVVGTIILIFYYFIKSKKLGILKINSKKEKTFKVIKRIGALAVPVALSSLMLPMVAQLDSLIVPFRLRCAGFTVRESTKLFGYLIGMAMPVIAGVSILTYSLSASLVPALSESRILGKVKDIKEKTALAYNISNIITIPSFFGLWLLATPISIILYKDVGASWSIAITSIGIFLLGIQQVSTAALQGMGKTLIPFINMIISAVIKIIITWIFTAMPKIGIKGAAWATNIDIGLAAVLNVFFVYKYIGFAIDIKKTAKITGTSIIMGISTLTIYNVLYYLTGKLVPSCLIAISIGIFIYIPAILFIGVFSEKEIECFPTIGSILIRKLSKYKLIKNKIF